MLGRSLATCVAVLMALTLMPGMVSASAGADRDDVTESLGTNMVRREPIGSPPSVRHVLILKSKKTNQANLKDPLGRCTTENATFHCTVSVSKASQRTVGVALGATRKFVTGSLNISSASTVAVSTSCSRKIKKNQVLVAYPLGSRHKYKIERREYAGGILNKLKKVTVSGWQTTFNPYKNAMTCKVEKR